MAGPPLTSRISAFTEKHRGWFMVYLAFVLLLVATGPPYNYNVLLVSLQEEFGSGAALTGWVGSIANTLLFINPLSPPLVRRFGPRAVGLFGACVQGGGLVATSFVPGLIYTHFTFGVAVGIGGNFLLQSAMVVVYDWFPDKHCSRATSAALLGTSVGVLVFAPILRTLLTAYGWRNSLRIAGGACFVVSVTHSAFIATRAKVDSGATEEVEANNNVDYQDATSQVGDEAGEPPRVDTESHASRRVDKACDVDMLPRVDTASKDDATKQVDTACHPTVKTFWQRLGKALLQADTWPWVIGTWLASVAWIFIIVNYAGFLEYDLLFTADQIAVALVLIGVGEVLGKALFSAFGDYLPCQRLYAYAGASLLAAVLCGLISVLRTVPLIYIISFILGPVRGVSYASPFSVSVDIFRDYGSDVVLFLTTAPIGLGSFSGAPLTGGLYDLTGDYTLTVLIMASICLLSSILVLMIPARKRLQKICCSRTTDATNTAPDEPTPPTISVNIPLEI